MSIDGKPCLVCDEPRRSFFHQRRSRQSRRHAKRSFVFLNRRRGSVHRDRNGQSSARGCSILLRGQLRDFILRGILSAQARTRPRPTVSSIRLSVDHGLFTFGLARFSGWRRNQRYPKQPLCARASRGQLSHFSTIQAARARMIAAGLKRDCRPVPFALYWTRWRSGVHTPGQQALALHYHTVRADVSSNANIGAVKQHGAASHRRPAANRHAIYLEHSIFESVSLELTIDSRPVLETEHVRINDLRKPAA